MTKNGVWIVEQFFSWTHPVTCEFLTSKQTVRKCSTKAEAVQVALSVERPNIRFHEYDEPEVGERFNFSEWLEYQP